MRVDLRPDLRPFAVSSQADGGLPRRPRRCAAGLGAASAFLGVFGGENEEGARNTYVAGILLAEANGSNQILRYYVYGQGLLAMVTPSGASYSYHYDATGNTVAMTDGSQAVVNRYAYTPYGRIVGKAETPGLTQPFQYVGQSGVMAEPNGFYYMRARYYDPEVGRFVSEDPIGFEGGDVNLYAYVQNNPVMFVDPSGLFRFDKRPLSGLPWIPVASSNPIDDFLNTEISHEHGFFDDGSNENIGFGPSGRFSEDPSDKRYRSGSEHYDDAIMRGALKNVNDGTYSNIPWKKNNCQDWAERLRGEYQRIKSSQSQSPGK